MNTINDEDIFKIKDSIDIFLTDNKYITAYFMNSRIRKNFKVNNLMIHLIESIDGEKSVKDLKRVMEENYAVESSDIDAVLEVMVRNKIVTKVISNNFICEEDKIRFSRQINYFSEFFEDENQGEAVQKKLFDSKVIIFGCGAVGGNIAIQLAMAGVRKICLFDNDILEESDCSRHLFFSDSSVGMKKTAVLAKKILKIDSKVKIDVIDQYMMPETDIEKYIKNFDFVINTLDEPYIGYTSSKISRICIKYNIPHYIAGGFDAHLSSTGEIIIPHVTPCVECYANYFKTSLKDWKPAKHPVIKRFNEIGGLASQSLFSSSFAVIEIIKYLTGIVDLKKSFKIRGEFLFTNMELTYLNVERDKNCLICGEKSSL